jgi:8-oxo-dGTP pyrophosphatase MutT (NUDIX family)
MGGPVVKAMAMVRRERDGGWLVSEYGGPDGPPFQRPLGGHVEVGERARQTVIREFVEEIGQELADVRLLGVLENLFEWRGSQQHEIVFVFAAALADPAAYEIAEQRIRDDADDWTRVIWRAADAVSPPIYPDGVLELARAGVVRPE